MLKICLDFWKSEPQYAYKKTCISKDEPAKSKNFYLYVKISITEKGVHNRKFIQSWQNFGVHLKNYVAVITLPKLTIKKHCQTLGYPIQLDFILADRGMVNFFKIMHLFEMFLCQDIYLQPSLL